MKHDEIFSAGKLLLKISSLDDVKEPAGTLRFPGSVGKPFFDLEAAHLPHPLRLSGCGDFCEVRAQQAPPRVGAQGKQAVDRSGTFIRNSPALNVKLSEPSTFLPQAAVEAVKVGTSAVTLTKRALA